MPKNRSYTRFQSKSVPFEVMDFSLATWAREALENAIRPIMEAHRDEKGSIPLSQYERETLAKAIRDTFPAEAIEALTDTLTGGAPRPIVVHNLPALEEGLVTMESRPRPSSLTSFYVGQGIYALMDMEAERAIVMSRKAGRPVGTKHPGHTIHSDSHDVSCFAAPLNDEGAETSLINWQSLLRDRDRTAFRGALLDIDGKKIDMADLQAETQHISPGMHIRYDRENSAPDALARLELAVEGVTEKRVVMPGDIVIWSNHSVYHKANEGAFERIDPQHYSRHAMLLGGHMQESYNQAI